MTAQQMLDGLYTVTQRSACNDYTQRVIRDLECYPPETRVEGRIAEAVNPREPVYVEEVYDAETGEEYLALTGPDVLVFSA